MWHLCLLSITEEMHKKIESIFLYNEEKKIQTCLTALNCLRFVRV